MTQMRALDWLAIAVDSEKLIVCKDLQLIYISASRWL